MRAVVGAPPRPDDVRDSASSGRHPSTAGTHTRAPAKLTQRGASTIARERAATIGVPEAFLLRPQPARKALQRVAESLCWVQMGLVDEVLPEDGDPDVAVAAFVRPFLKPAHSTGGPCLLRTRAAPDADIQITSHDDLPLCPIVF